MKYLLIILFASITLSCKAQVYPLNTSPYDIPANSYIKDTNNELDKYVGLWKGNWNGKTIFLELKKIKYYYNDNHPFYSDEILGERKIVSSNGTIEIDRISNFGSDGVEFRGMHRSLKYMGKETINFYPRNMCGKTATIHIINFNPTQMTLNMEYNPSFFKADCIHNAYVDQNHDWPINFPKDIVLTKQ
ncbi:hypothetical protein HIO71_06370 [Chryseobacterium aquaticum]|uniref:DUF6705 domain-containing protein n=1 Tax=Chryseobacterium aquaticum TaxID=452084 RepID=A0A848N8X4_9FLAO|nr:MULTISPECIES: DUF6705 family protein [Chryseobacterium]NMR33833.1 hypothetical protein [Chryseobacterium aquaticum]NRQ45909.1 hypothetical protein [Chryseobacterium sp. C-204]